MERDKSLQALNTFGFDQRAERYAEAPDETTLLQRLDDAERAGWPVLLLGGGSNIVLTRDVEGLVIHPIERKVAHASGSTPGSTLVTASAGVDWTTFVDDCVAAGLDGLENLSLIPGSLGAAPVQNIGAYGVELADRLHTVRAWHRPSRRWLTLGPADCEFGYRDSRFKRERDDWVITQVSFELGPYRPRVLGYATLDARLADLELDDPTAADVARAVTHVRRSRLPDPARIGNAGSFFENPIVSADDARALTGRFPDMVMYEQPDGRVKLAAGWMIDQLGFRGHRHEGVGVHESQALVLVNLSGDGRALLDLVSRIREAVRERFDVSLTVEPRLI